MYWLESAETNNQERPWSYSLITYHLTFCFLWIGKHTFCGCSVRAVDKTRRWHTSPVPGSSLHDRSKSCHHCQTCFLLDQKKNHVNFQYAPRFFVDNRARSFPVAPLLAHACTQVHRFSQRNPADSAYLCETDVSKYVWQEEWRNPVYVRRVDSSALL